jgi:hypothetical protein
MDLQTLAAEVGLSPDHCVSLLQRVYAFESSLSPVELQAIEKLISDAQKMPPSKRQEIQQFLATQVAGHQGGIMAGICVSTNPPK